MSEKLSISLHEAMDIEECRFCECSFRRGRGNGQFARLDGGGNFGNGLPFYFLGMLD